MLKFILRHICGVRIGKACVFKGLPFMRVGGRDSVIEIGDRLAAISRLCDNPIGVEHPVIVRTVAPGAKITIGDDVGLSGCTIAATKSITIGNRVMIGSGAMVFDSDFHPIDPVLRYQEPWNKGECKPIVVEDDVFIGARAMILKGVTIGKGAVVGAGAVVTKDVPSGVTVVGNPARIVDRI